MLATSDNLHVGSTKQLQSVMNSCIYQLGCLTKLVPLLKIRSLQVAKSVNHSLLKAAILQLCIYSSNGKPVLVLDHIQPFSSFVLLLHSVVISLNVLIRFTDQK